MSLYIRSVSTTAGFLEKSPVEFATGLTCVIGARGTCKSTLVESIRFAFDCKPERVNVLIGSPSSSGDPQHSLIRSTLGAGTVRCELMQGPVSSHSHHIVEREVGSEPRLFLDGVREHADYELLKNIEIFSQGDLQKIAEDKNDTLRLDLIDRAHKARIEQLTRERKAAERLLARVGPDLRNIRSSIQQMRIETQPLPHLQSKLEEHTRNGPVLPPQLEVEHRGFQQRAQLVERLRLIDAKRGELTEKFSSLLPLVEDITRLLDSARSTGGEILQPSGSDAVLLSISETLAAFPRLADRLRSAGLSAAINELVERFENDNQTFYKLRQEQNAINESLKQRQHLERQIAELTRRSEELAVALETERQLLAERGGARQKINLIDDEIYRLRIGEIEAINAEHGASVFLTLQSGLGSSGYWTHLDRLLSGSRIRNQEDVARAIASTVSPAKLVDIVESGTGQILADRLDRDLGQMNRVVAHLVEHADLYSLEGEPPLARLEITLFDNGEPKPVETLSKGQKATALLPLILRPLPYPLIIDQPEDDLDNSFIFRSLIQTVRKLKTQRQLIFVTHNANIPVLGEAERVVVMQMVSPKQADKPRSGSVDERKVEILELLEGGAEAFVLRENSYRELLHHD